MNSETRDILEYDIINYGATKEAMAPLDKLAKELGKDIKDVFAKEGLDKYSVGDYEATVTNVQKESFNDDELIRILKEVGKQKGIVKRKEYVDMDALESAIYHNDIDAALLAPAQTITTTPTLRIKRLK
jgi:arsenate reductase-like glutaredoxin family protein